MKIALFGADPIRPAPFPAWPQFDGAEEEGLRRSLRQGQWWRVHGSEVKAFEAEFAQHHGAPSAIAVTNGTHALEVALLAAGIGPGHEVIVPAFTFVSTSMAVQRVGATPVPVDIDPVTYCMDPERTKEALTERTKALLPVHMSGHFADMRALAEIADDYDLILIQDAAHAHGARGAEGKRCGDWNTLACFSFQNFKLMTAGEGGIVLCPTEEVRESVYLHANCGRPEGDTAYMHTVCGSNYRMNEFSAAVLRAQLARLDSQTVRRERNAEVIKKGLAELQGVEPQGRLDYAEIHPHYMFMFILDEEVYPDLSRDQFVTALIAEGIPAFKAYRALYRIPAFWRGPHPGGSEEVWAEKCPYSDRIGRRGIWIHHRALLGTEQDAMDVVHAIKHVLAHRHLLQAKAA